LQQIEQFQENPLISGKCQYHMGSPESSWPGRYYQAFFMQQSGDEPFFSNSIVSEWALRNQTRKDVRFWQYCSGQRYHDARRKGKLTGRLV